MKTPDPLTHTPTLKATLNDLKQSVLMIWKYQQLASQLYRALLLAKSDAEKNGFSYGPQSTIVKALHAYQSRSSSSSSPSKT